MTEREIVEIIVERLEIRGFPFIETEVPIR